MAGNTVSGLSVAVVHESKIEELIRSYDNFSSLKTLNISEDNSILWDMKGKNGYCIQAMFIGKTGYGKSTTLNKICGQEFFKTDAIRSCTKTLFSAEYKLKTKKNHFLSLCDLPGIGESVSADKTYAKYYAEMLIKSHCVVYVMRADQRDYSQDQEILGPMLENKEQKKKIMLAVNFTDKIEPMSCSKPFSPNGKQIENINAKLIEIQRLFKIRKSNIIFYSAKEEYNLDKIVKGIILILKESVKTEPTFQEITQKIWRMTPRYNCGECGCTNCMSFAMQAASKKNRKDLSYCEYIDEDEAEEFYNRYLRDTGDSTSNQTLEEAIARQGIMGNPALDDIFGKFMAIPLRTISKMKK